MAFKYFGFENTWCRLFQKRVLCTNFNVHVFIRSTSTNSCSNVLWPKCHVLWNSKSILLYSWHPSWNFCMRDGFSQIGSLIALYVGRHFTHFGKHLNDRIKSLKEDVRAVDVDHVLYIYQHLQGRWRWSGVIYISTSPVSYLALVVYNTNLI